MSGGVETTDDIAARRHVDLWWNKLLTDEDRTCMEHSGKLILLFDILSLAQQMGDKVSVPSACSPQLLLGFVISINEALISCG